MNVKDGKFWKKLRSVTGEGVTLALLVPLAIVAGLILIRINDNDSFSDKSVAVDLPSPKESLLPEIAGVISNKQIEPQAESQTVTILVNDAGSEKEVKVFVVPGEAVITVMERAQSLSLATLETKDFGGELGVFVEAINGIRNDVASSKYWTLYINGERSNVGASLEIVQPGDTITWKFENINN